MIIVGSAWHESVQNSGVNVRGVVVSVGVSVIEDVGEVSASEVGVQEGELSESRDIRVVVEFKVS